MKRARLVLLAALALAAVAAHAQDHAPRPQGRDHTPPHDEDARPADRRGAADDMPAAPLRVHEWGVWHLGRNGRVDSLASLAAESPPFVHRAPAVPPAQEPDLGPGIPPSWQNQAFDKPVVFLYADAALDVTVRVRVPHGRPWLYFPDATTGRIAGDRGLAWTGQVLPVGTAVHGATQPPLTSDASWWNFLRAVPASPFVPSGASSYETFLFYDGEAPFPVGFHVRGSDVAPIAGHVDPLAWVVDAAGSARLDVQGAAATRTALRTPSEVLRGLQLQLVARGLTAMEADSLIHTWRAELVATGARHVIWLLPRASYDAMLPLEVSPTPLEVVRVGVVIQAY